MSQELEQLKQQAELNRLVFQQRLLSTPETNTNDISDGFDATTGKMRVKSTDGSISYVNVITNGAIGIGDDIDLRGQFADSTPRINKHETIKKQEVDKASIITLLKSDQIPANSQTFPIPPGFKEIEFWLTGGTPKQKRIVNVGFDVSSILPFIYEDQKVITNLDFLSAFLINKGDGKYLIAGTRLEETKTNYEGDYDKKYYKTIVTISKNKQISQFSPTIYFNRKQTLYYLGNGIYQSVADDGIGRILAAIPNRINIPGAVMRYLTPPLVEIAGLYGIEDPNPTGEPPITIEINGEEITIDIRFKVTSNVLPEAQNICIHDGTIDTLIGTIEIDIDGIFDDIEFTNNDDEYYPPYPDRVYFYRNKTITHNVWLPRGTSQLSFTSIKNSDPNTVVGGNTVDYTYTENLSCEVIVAAWDKKYITSSLNITTENINGLVINNVDPFAPYRSINTHESQKTEVLRLKSYSDNTGTNDLILNNGKFLVLKKKLLDPTTKNPITFNLDTESFLIRVDPEPYGNNTIKDINYEISCLGFDIQAYVGENIITSFLVDENIYIVKGAITFASYTRIPGEADTSILDGLGLFAVTNSKWKRTEFTINVTSIKKAYSGNQKTYFKNTILPLPYIVLDNGCFWNYYLSTSIPLRNSSLVAYPFFINGQHYSTGVSSDIYQGAAFFPYFLPVLLCDQTLTFVCTNPLTRPFCRPQYFDNYYPPDNILKTDNLVGNSIYRVNAYDDEIGSYPKQDANFKQISVSQWDIKSNGDIKYKKTFLVPYTLKRPFYNSNDDKCDTREIIPQSHSYHP